MSDAHGKSGSEPNAEPPPRTLPSGAVVNSGVPPVDLDKPARVSRRKLLVAGGVGVAAAAGLGSWAVAGRRQSASAGGRLTLAYGGDVCEAPLYVAHEKGFFAAQGLDVSLVKTGTGEDTHPAVGSGKYAAAPGIFFSWLKPIEQGVDVKLVAGLHEGCLRLVVRDDGEITDLKQLRGRRIGVSGLSSSALNFFSLDLLDAGVVPSPEAGQVEWVVIDNDLLPAALADKRVDAIAASDPVALLATLKSPARELTNNRRGPNAQQYCCATAINGALVREEPETVRKLVTAWADGSRWVGSNIEETARIEVDKHYVAGTVDQIVPILQSYSYNPSAKNLRAALVPGIEKFAGTGFLDKRTEATELADKVYADLGLTW